MFLWNFCFYNDFLWSLKQFYHVLIYRILAQWEETQRKTYTKWVNMYLAKRKPPVKLDDVIEDFKKGPERICELLELLCGIKIDMEGGKLPGQATSRFHQINIVQNALDTLQQSKPDIKLIGISSSDIIDGKPAIVLGFVWKMVLNFQVNFGTFISF